MHLPEGRLLTYETTTRLNYADELKHFDELYRAEINGYQEAEPKKQAALDDLGRNLKAANDRFGTLGHSSEDDAELDSLLTSVRESIKLLDAKTSHGGPPMA